MTEQDFLLLKELVEAPSPSGFEQPARQVLRAALAPVADDVRVDVMGNLIVRQAGAGENPLRVMLAAHCDEIGFMVRYIDDSGFLWFAPIGGVDPHLVPGQRVTIHSASGPLPGVVGKKPIHLIEAKEREAVVKFKQQFIDIGVSDRKSAEKLVAIGDPVTFAAGLERLQGERVTSRAFDDKVGAFVMARVLHEVRRRGGVTAEVYGVATVQEEVGLRGAAASCYGVNPDVGLVIEVGFATDVPDGDKKEQGDIRLGAGAVISRGPNVNPALFALLQQAAREEQIPVQLLAEARATGTDANVMQLSRGGVATALVRIPLRYMHTPAEVLDLADIEAAVRLVTALLQRLTTRAALLPE